MRKLFLFLFAALMSVGMFATTVVTITQNDFPQHGTSFTKDGVTVSAGDIDGMDGNLRKGGSFSTTLGNFTKIVVTAEGCEASGTGWSGNWSSMTWAGTPASTVSFSGEFMGMGMGITIVCTIEEPTVAVTGVTLNQNEAQMTVGEELTLTATVNPGNATNKDVMWSSDNGYVATIENGVITAEGEGTATITVTTVDGEYTATCAVTVTAATPEPQPTTVTWGATEFSSFGVDYLYASSRTVKGITVTVNAANNNFINVTEFGNTFNATIDNAFTFSTELGNITKIECTTLYAKGTLGDGWTIGANSATWEGNTNTLNLGNAGSMLVVSNIIFTIGGGSTPEPQNTDVNVEGGQDPQNTTYYYSTFFDSQVKYLLPAGVEAYVATISDDALTLTRIAVAGQTIPANNAVIFRANAENFTLTPSTADAVTFSATNSLQGTDIEINNVSDCYVLSDEDGVIGFYKYTGSLLHAHKAYIIFNGPSSAPRRMRFIFAEEQNTTALDNAETDNMSVKVIENGQLVIIRNGVRYNAAGQVIE